MVSALYIIFDSHCYLIHCNFYFVTLKSPPPPLFTGTTEVSFSVSKEGMAWGPVRRAERLQVNECGFDFSTHNKPKPEERHSCCVFFLFFIFNGVMFYLIFIGVTFYLINVLSDQLKILCPRVCRNVCTVWRAYLEGVVKVTQSRIGGCDSYRSQISEPIKTFRVHKDQQLKKVHRFPKHNQGTLRVYKLL